MGVGLVLMSGGIDSTACAHFVGAQNMSVRGVFANYGQPALQQERRAVARVCRQLGVSLRRVEIRLPTTLGPGEIVGRNALLAMAALPLVGRDTRLIVMGIHAGTPYYDCSRTFAKRINTLIQEYTDGRVQFIAPFLTWSKKDIVSYCRQNALDLSATYSCEAGGRLPCGNCLSCKDRRSLDV